MSRYGCPHSAKLLYFSQCCYSTTINTINIINQPDRAAHLTSKGITPSKAYVLMGLVDEKSKHEAISCLYLYF